MNIYYCSEVSQPDIGRVPEHNFSCQFNQHREQQGLVVLATVMQLSEAVLGAYCLLHMFMWSSPLQNTDGAADILQDHQRSARGHSVGTDIQCDFA